jgi:protein involved in temperature-dependent protein secretion
MRTEEWLSQGNLEEAIAQARQDVSRTPENAGFRFPSLYSGTGAKDDFLRLGQMTTWDYPSSTIGRAYGQRDLKTDKILKGIRKVSTILIDRPSSN